MRAALGERDAADEAGGAGRRGRARCEPLANASRTSPRSRSLPSAPSARRAVAERGNLEPGVVCDAGQVQRVGVVERLEPRVLGERRARLLRLGDRREVGERPQARPARPAGWRAISRILPGLVVATTRPVRVDAPRRHPRGGMIAEDLALHRHQLPDAGVGELQQRSRAPRARTAVPPPCPAPR